MIWRWSLLIPSYVTPTLEMFDRRSDDISPTVPIVVKDRTAAAYIFHSPTLEHDSCHKLEEVWPPELSLPRGIHSRLGEPP